MSFNEVIDRLDKQYLAKLLEKLKIIDVQRELFLKEEEFLSIKELKILAESANILALSDDDEDKTKALEIALTLPKVNGSTGLYLSAYFTLRKLGNYPAIKMLESKNGDTKYSKSLPGITMLEEQIFESLNERQFVNEVFTLTDFQKNLYDDFEEFKGVSISAPTSAGKSFIFINYIMNMVHTHKEGITIIYIVPTRSLIKQVMNDFLNQSKLFGLENIYIGCSSEIETLLKNPKRSNILVLTQERLFQLCTNIDAPTLKVKMIVVDEAHNIQSGGRGILLESAIRYAQIKFPTAKLSFSSPLVKNPEKFLTVFNLENGKNEKDNFPLVSQNLIKVNKRANDLTIQLHYQNKDIPLHEIPFKIKGNSRAKILANVSLKLWNNQTSIIYASEPMLSTDVARELIESGEFPNLNNSKLDDFADFIEDFISENYELAKFIRQGIAFHFGALPSIIRSGIEDLFKEGCLKIVVCTSTLLEGLNMPAKNIFMYRPEKGREPLDNLNFWNLSGRAGRMGHDFSGNIICIDIGKWDINPLLGLRSYSINTSSELKLKKDAINFKNYISDRNKPSGIDDYSEQLLSMIVRNKLNGEKLEDSSFVTEENKDVLIEIDAMTSTILLEFKPPKELLEISQGVIPDRINDLWQFFVDNKEDYKKFMPLYPIYLYDDSYNRFVEILMLINRFFLTKNTWSEKHIQKISITGHKWMTGQPLSNIIFYNDVSKTYTEKKLTSYVKDQIKFLNDTIRYKMVKYTQIYLDVLRIFLNSINKKEEADKLIGLSSYLEYGASSAPALEFMAQGLPREAAITLDKKITIRNDVSSEYYLDWLKNLNVDRLEIENYLKVQILLVQKSL